MLCLYDLCVGVHLESVREEEIVWIWRGSVYVIVSMLKCSLNGNEPQDRFCCLVYSCRTFDALRRPVRDLSRYKVRQRGTNGI
jgi:hypothetical protein